MKRFKTGVNLLYDDLFKDFKNSSEILSGYAPLIAGVHTIFWDKNRLEYALVELIGDEKGLGVDGKSLASIPYTKERLKNLETEFENYADRKEAEGYERPTEMFPEMSDKQIRLFARLDVMEEEATAIKKKLDSMQDVVDKEDERKVLHCGLMCNVHLIGGVVSEIDGQRCGRTKEGVFIVDERSPYCGMSVPDYRKLSKAWQESRKQSDREHLKIIQADALAKGADVPTYYRSFGGGRAIKKSLLPDWPAGVVNHLEDNKTVRTK